MFSDTTTKELDFATEPKIPGGGAGPDWTRPITLTHNTLVQSLKYRAVSTPWTFGLILPC